MKNMILNTFTILSTRLIPDINMQATELLNENNGMRVLKLIPLDPEYTESTFDVAFLTPPENSTGLPHITEHSVLCGSNNFNLKEPFQILLQQSLQTYLNAGTYSEHTVYPFATRNEQDFYNIMEVYLDAVFNPKIHKDELIFKQEGHHLHLENGKLEDKGVVLNEMKGAYSDPQAVGSTAVEQLMFKDGSMSNIAGGIPEEIVKLTAEDLKNFHKTHYTTDNSFLVLVSKYPIERELALVMKYTKDAFRGKPTPVIKQVERVQESKKVEFGVSQEQETMIMNGYRLYDNDKVSALEFIAHNVLDNLIHDSPASLFKKALGGSFSSSLDYSQAQALITLTISGSTLSYDEIQTTIQRIYKELSEDSEYLNANSLKASLNKYEFKYKEIKDHHGISVANKVFLSWIYGGKFDKLLTQQEAIKQLKSMKPEEFVQYFRNLIKQYYQPQIQVEMIPVVGLADRKHEQEAKEFEERLAKMTEEEKQQIIKEQEEIQNRQKVPNDPEELKKVGKLKEKDLKNIGDQIKNLEGHLKTVDQFSFYEFDTNSAGICHLRICFDMSADADTEMISYAALAARILTRVRTDKYESLQDLNQQMDNVTGTVKAQLIISDTDNGARVVLAVYTKFLVELSEQALELLNEIITTSINHLTPKILSEIVDEYQNELNNNLKSRSGYELAFNRAMAQYSSAAAAQDYTSGLQMLAFLKSGPTIQRLQRFFKKVNYSFPMLFCIGTHKSQFQLMEQKLDATFSPYKPISAQISRLFTRTPQIHSNLSAMRQKSISAPVNVNYVAVAFDHHQIINSPALMLSDTILSKSFLWDNVRVLGGAYGCFLATSLKMQQYIVSYRDPNLNKTFETYKKIPEHLKSLNLSKDELFSFKIGALGQRQKSIAPEQRFLSGMTYFFEGVSVHTHGDLVNGIVNVGLEDLHNTAEIYQKLVDGNQVVVGKANDVRKWAEENAKECEDM
ncbi:Insulinase [Hexamita inflata]|uniref:Insulinase n=1 Tax=Hexamita inflata TaxID=28002 RepID=A0ABP1K264_9EUKA